MKLLQAVFDDIGFYFCHVSLKHVEDMNEEKGQKMFSCFWLSNKM